VTKILGVGFEPYVGPWDGAQPVLFNAYSHEQVVTLLKPVAERFERIRTYGQGTFIWDSKPKVQDSNRYNIAAASDVGLKVSAGAYQQGADPGADSINVAWTETEIDYAISEAHLHGNVDELIVGNECLWGPGSAADLRNLIDYAKLLRDTTGFTAKTLPITTCQQWGVLAGVGNMDPSFAPMREALLNLLAACEGHVYANMYAYFDSSIASKLGNNPSKAAFTAAATASMEATVCELAQAFADANVSKSIRIGETGWPTSGTQTAQPAKIASNEHAQWYYEAMDDWLPVPTYWFAGYDEPWKGNRGGGSSEAYFGLWTADGTSTAPDQYTLVSETRKW